MWMTDEVPLTWINCIVLHVRFFFFNDTATTEIYTLSLHDALPISFVRRQTFSEFPSPRRRSAQARKQPARGFPATPRRRRALRSQGSGGRAQVLPRLRDLAHLRLPRT